jgi:glyoxylase-like metal-dependent hydrolase (beta-lactamase superfamily II)
MVQPFFEPVTGTVSYVVFQSGQPECAIVDPVLDYDPKSGRTATTNADRVIEFVRQKGMHVKWILETHAHIGDARPHRAFHAGQYAGWRSASCRRKRHPLP